MLESLQQASGHVGDKISVIIPCYNREKYMCLGACLYNYRYNTAGVWNSDKAPDYIMECFHTQEELVQMAAECAQGMEREIE